MIGSYPRALRATMLMTTTTTGDHALAQDHPGNIYPNSLSRPRRNSRFAPTQFARPDLARRSSPVHFGEYDEEDMDLAGEINPGNFHPPLQDPIENMHVPEGWIPPEEHDLQDPRRATRHALDEREYDEDDQAEDDRPEQGARRQRGLHAPRRGRGGRGYIPRQFADDGIDDRRPARRDIKVRIEPFKGDYDPAAFIEWVQGTEHTLAHCHYEPHEQVEVATLHFVGAARTWWHRDVANRIRRGFRPIVQWHQLVFVMTQKYVPPEYKHEMRMKIALARQGTSKPNEFYATLEDMYYKAGMSVSPATMRTKFLSGLHVAIRDQLEVLPIKDLSTLVHTAMQLHAQQVRKSTSPWSSNQRYGSTTRFSKANDSPRDAPQGLGHHFFTCSIPPNRHHPAS